MLIPGEPREERVEDVRDLHTREGLLCPVLRDHPADHGGIHVDCAERIAGDGRDKERSCVGVAGLFRAAQQSNGPVCCDAAYEERCAPAGRVENVSY